MDTSTMIALGIAVINFIGIPAALKFFISKYFKKIDAMEDKTIPAIKEILLQMQAEIKANRKDIDNYTKSNDKILFAIQELRSEHNQKHELILHELNLIKKEFVSHQFCDERFGRITNGNR